MKITKKRSIIIAVSLAVVMAFGAVISNSFNFNAEVLAAETQENVADFSDGSQDYHAWVNHFGIFGNQRWHSNNELQERFLHSESDFDGRFVTMGSWSMFNVNGFDNLEIHLVNSSIRFAINEDDMADFFASHSVIEENRAFLITGRIGAHGYIPSPSNSTVYIIDSPRDLNQDSMLTISVPKSDAWLFDSINIIVENGNVEMADIFKNFLAENITINTISGDVVRINDDEVIRFSPNMRRTERPTPSLTPLPTPTPRPQDTTTGFAELRQAGNTMRETFPHRFPYSNANSDIISINFNGGWDSRVADLEIYLLNANLKIVPLDMDRTFWGFHRPNTPTSVVVESSDFTTAHTLIGANRVYIWDNFSAYDGLVTLHVPLNAGWVFESANIHLENGDLIIIADYPIEDFLAESLNVAVVNGVLTDENGVHADIAAGKALSRGR